MRGSSSAGDTHLSIDVETLVVAQVNLSETLSFLEVAVVCSTDVFQLNDFSMD